MDLIFFSCEVNIFRGNKPVKVGKQCGTQVSQVKAALIDFLSTWGQPNWLKTQYFHHIKLDNSCLFTHPEGTE